jgi:hypothetical protein
MHASSMIDRANRHGTIAKATLKRARGASIGRVVMIAAACLVEAILILGFVVASLGLGYEGQPGVSPRLEQPRPQPGYEDGDVGGPWP